MEFNKELSYLIERVRSLQGNLNVEIQNTSSSVKFCKLCSECVESERLITIRDNIKEVENILSFLQKLRSWQVNEKHEALSCLEGSRLVLMELVETHQGKYTPRVVLGELRSYFDHVIDQPNLNSKKWSVSSLMRKLFMNWKWNKCIGNGLKFLLFCVTISSIVKVGRIQKLYTNSLTLNSSEEEIRDNLLTISRNPLDVFQARG